MNYCYFGNTSLKVSNLLYNIEAQLILFKDLFKNTNENDVWADNSELQNQYLELLIQNKLINTSDTKTGSKNARTKSAPLENYNLVNRKEKKVTELGNELLFLLNNKKFKEYNNFLQIDLVSLFFFKATLNVIKEDGIKDIFLNYLKVFKAFNGQIPIEKFKLIPLICNFKDEEYFISKLKKSNLNKLDLFSDIFSKDENLKEGRKEFLYAINKNNFEEPNYFKSSKGISAANIVIELYKIFCDIRNKNYNKDTFRNLFKNKVNENKNHYKNLYLRHLYSHNKLSVHKSNSYHLYKTILIFTRKGSYLEFNNRFFDWIYSSRSLNNIKDYYQQNRYYLNLTGAFEFKPDEVSITDTLNIILQHSDFEKIIKDISEKTVSIDSLDYLFEDKEIKNHLKSLNIVTTEELKDYKKNKDKEKLLKLLESNFTRNKISSTILPLFKNRQDDKIKSLVTENATVPTIFEYITAISWYYIDSNNINFILNAGLSLDSNMLPKSHAVGGSSDFEIFYDDHTLMIEVTLTEKTNQRRAEMESVSRHLGNILLSISDDKRRRNTYGIFIASYLDKNILNDFRLRQLSYWENNGKHIKGMNIIPLDIDDVINIINSNKIYSKIKLDFYSIIKSNEDWGSKWYQNEIKPYCKNLVS